MRAEESGAEEALQQTEKKKRSIAVLKKVGGGFKKFGRQWELQSMVIPWLVVIFVFCYLPMFGIIIAFKDFRFNLGIFGSQWVGFENFLELFKDKSFFLSIRNTLAINLLKLVFSFPLPIVFTILLNEMNIVGLKKATQTLSYLPHFVSWVIVAGIFGNLFALDGLINAILVNMHIVDGPVQYLAKEWFFWPLMVISGVWKETGWNAIIYIAALGNVNPELYEAAEVDGAGRFAKIWHVTLPALVPTIRITLLFTLAGLFNAGFDQIYLFQNDLILDVGEVLDTYIYRYGLSKGLYSFAGAAGLIQSVVNFSIILAANFISKKVSGSGLF